MLACRGRLTSRVVPTTMPTAISGTSRSTSDFTASPGFSVARRSELTRSCSPNTASAYGSGTKCVASGMVSIADPNPEMP